MPKAGAFVAALAAEGRYHFSGDEFGKALGLSPVVARNALRRLARRNLIASPARGFYVILPPEYRQLGCLPAEQFIPALMEQRGLRYYAGLLSAAQYHGAAHHRPQAFQVFLGRNRPSIVCGAVRIEFIARKRITDVPVQSVNTPRGTLLVSTVEATAVDLIGHPQHVGGLDHVATVLAELAERIDPDLLVVAAKTAPVPWAQRLGYLLELIGAGEKAAALRAYVLENARDFTSLTPGLPHDASARAANWRVYVNVEVEAEA